jgi:hypothetical protein
MASNLSARWLLGGGHHAVVEVLVPPGPLGILLDGDELDRPVLEGFAQVSPSDPQQRGAVETSGRVAIGSLLVGVNEYDFIEEDLGFDDVGDVLRETSQLPRTLKFHVPVEAKEESNVPLSQQFAPRRGPPPREEEEESEEEGDEEEDEEEEEEAQVPLKQVTEQQSSSDLPLREQFAPRRGPPPREEEEASESEAGDGADNVEFESGSSAEESFQEIDLAGAVVAEEVVQAPAYRATEDQGSDGSASWTLTGSNLGGSATGSTPLASSVSSASPEKLQPVSIEGSRQLSPKPMQQPLTETPQQTSAGPVKPLSIEIVEPPPSMPTELSFGTMAALAETRHFDSDDSSDGDSADDDSDEELDAAGQPSSRGVRWNSVEAEQQPEELPPQKPQQPSPVPLSMASNVSSGTIAASLMVQTNQFDRDDSVEEDDDTEYVTVVAPPGPLGLNLDGGVLDCAVVMGFAKLRDGSKGALERNGDIVPGSVLVRINGDDFSRSTLSEVSARLGELSQQPRTLVFRLPPRAQQEAQYSSPAHPSTIRRAPTLPPFEEDFDKRRKLELALIMRYDKSVLARRECWFCVDSKWMARWVDFVARGGPEPGPISNEALLHQNWHKMLASDAPGRPDTARDGLLLMSDYRVVAPMVWCLFAELHGLGQAPPLARYLMDIHAEALSDGEIRNVLEVPRPKATVLANNLRDKCLVRPSKAR